MEKNKKILPNLKNIVNEAFVLANDFNSPQLKPEHVLLSMIDNGNNLVVDVLTGMGVDLDNLCNDITKVLNDTDINLNVVSVKYKGKVPPSDITKIVFNEADTQAEKFGDNNIDTVHFMLGLLSISADINELLLTHNIEYDNFFKIGRDMKINNSYMSGGGSSDDYQFDGDIPKMEEIKTDGGDTPVLDNFCRDITKLAKEKALDPIVGREKEIKRVSQILSRRKKNNPVLLGEPGVGKCFCSDTEVIMRNDLTGEVFKTTINSFLGTITKV